MEILFLVLYSDSVGKLIYLFFCECLSASILHIREFVIDNSYMFKSDFEAFFRGLLMERYVTIFS